MFESHGREICQDVGKKGGQFGGGISPGIVRRLRRPVVKEAKTAAVAVAKMKKPPQGRLLLASKTLYPFCRLSAEACR